MIIYFADRTMTILGQASTGLPGGLLASGDKKTEELDTGSKTLEFDLGYTDRSAAEAMTMPGNYMLRSADGEDEFYTIIDAETSLDDRTVHVYAEEGGLDLLNEIVGEYSAPSAMTIAEYVGVFAAGSGFEVGINEVSDRTRTLSWEGEATVTERLQSLATQFDAELSFSFDIDKLQVIHRYINFWKVRGKNIGKTLRIGHHIEKVRITRSVANLATALRVKGGIPSGSSTAITLSGYSYDDGDIYVDGEYLKSRSALAQWARNGTEHIEKPWSYDTTSQSELCSRAVTQLKKVSQMEVTYSAEVISLPKSVQVGDVVKIADEEGGQYIKARITKLEASASEGRRNIKLSDYTTSGS